MEAHFYRFLEESEAQKREIRELLYSTDGEVTPFIQLKINILHQKLEALEAFLSKLNKFF